MIKPLIAVMFYANTGALALTGLYEGQYELSLGFIVNVAFFYLFSKTEYTP